MSLLIFRIEIEMDRNFRRNIDNHTSLEDQKLQVPSSSYVTGPGKGGKEVRKGSNNNLK